MGSKLKKGRKSTERYAKAHGQSRDYGRREGRRRQRGDRGSGKDW